jgi:hypothetical protein
MMAPMHPVPIPVRPEPAVAAHAGCGACHHGTQADCSAALPAGGEPQLLGPADRLQAVLARLQPAVEAELGAVVGTGAWLRSLRLIEGEAEVTLAPGLACRAAGVANVAFDTLRALLPDTDIYIDTAAH